MRLPLSQLNRLIECHQSPTAIGETLESLGHEVELIEHCASVGQQARCALITDKKVHPRRSDLFVYQVQDDVAGSTRQLISSRAMLETGQRVAVMTAGGCVAGQTIKPRNFDQLESQAVFCTAADLGLPNPDWYSTADGVLSFYPQDATAGSVDQILGLPDTILTLKPTPNRGDCLSVLGLARELTARLNLPWRQSEWQPFHRPTTDSLSSANVPSPELGLDRVEGSLHYSLACLSLPDGRDWHTESSPSWLQAALCRFGQRPIALLVDMTNFYMYVYGQPMHIFDADKIVGKVSVRFSQAGEVFSSLTHQQIELQTGELVIADQQKILALAGIYGGDQADLDQHTKRVAVECAAFEPRSVYGRARRYNLHTESSLRYERGIDPGACDHLLEHSLNSLRQLIPQAQWQGTAAYRRDDRPTRRVPLSEGRLRQYLGYVPEKLEQTLNSLGFIVNRTASKNLMDVQVPSWRDDVSFDVCLIEELMRMGELEGIERRRGFSGHSTSVGSDHDRWQTASWQRIQKVRHDWISRGFSETCTYSFISDEDDRLFFSRGDDVDQTKPVVGWSGMEHHHTAFAASTDVQTVDGAARLHNPISQELSVLRRSLIPSLCRLLHFHLNRQFDNLRLFEIGSVFHQNKDGFDQRTVLSALMYGDLFPLQWGQPRATVDFYALLGLVQNHLQLFLPGKKFEYRPSRQKFLQARQSSDLYLDGHFCGCLGSVHPSITQHFQFNRDVWVMEIDAGLYRHHAPVRKSVIPSHTPSIRRDFSFLVPVDLVVSRLLIEIEALELKNLKKLSVFDLYSGKNIDSDCKSVSLLLIFNEKNTSLLESEVDASCQRLLKHLQKLFPIKLRN